MNPNNLLAFMSTAARTAPKSKGYDDLIIKAEKNNLILGVNTKKPPKINCGLCGCNDCNGFVNCLNKGKNVNCVFKILDLAIAIGSASYTAEKFGFNVSIEYLGAKFNCDLSFNIKIKKEKIEKDIQYKNINDLEDIDKKTIGIIIDFIESEIKNSKIKKISQIRTKFIEKSNLKKFTQEIKPNLFLKDKKYESLDKKQRKYLWFIDSDKEVLEKSDGVFAVGVKTSIAEGIDCGLCGCKDCLEFRKELNRNRNVNCAFRIIDFGILTGRIVGILADYRIDNRIFYSIGEAVRKKEFKDCNLVLGIGLSVKGNNIFFDRYLRHFIDKSRQTGKKIDEILGEKGIV